MNNVFTIVGNRPQFMKLDPELRQVIVHTGQHYDKNMSEDFFRDLDLPEPDFNLKCKQPGQILDKLMKLFRKEKPSLVLVYGDTYSTFMGALAASYCGIKVAHIEAGFRSGNFNMPEEFNRILTDRISAVRFCFTMEAFRNLNAEGLLDHTYFFKGDPMFDSMNRFLPIRRLKAYRTYDLVTMHRNFNVDNPERLRSILGVLGSIKWSFWFPVHPRTAKMLIGMKIPQNVKLMKPQSYKKMLSLESNARKIITDSGGVSREAYWMRIPQIILRKETEFNHIISDGWGKLAWEESEIKSAIETFSPDDNCRQSETVIFGVNKLIREALGKYV